MARALGAIERGSLALTAQDEGGVTYAAKLAKTQRARLERAVDRVHDHIGVCPHFRAPGSIDARRQAGPHIKVLRTTRESGTGGARRLIDDPHCCVPGCAVRINRIAARRPSPP